MTALFAIALACCVPQEPTPLPGPTHELRTGTAPSRALGRELANEEQLALFDLFATPETEAGHEFPWSLQHLEDKQSYARWDLSFPSPLALGPLPNQTVHAKLFLPEEHEGPMPAVVVLHWLEGDFSALDLLCVMLAQRGVAALMMYMPHYGPRRSDRARMVTPAQEQLVENFRQAVLDVRRAGDWLAAQPEFDPQRIGVMGISLGSIVCELAAGVDRSFTRQVFLIGGADVPSIVMSPAPEVRAVRKHVRELGMGLEELRRIWRPLEPLTWADRIRPESTLMLAATEDEVIPRSCTEALQSALGLEQIEWYEGGHYDIAFQFLRVGGMAATHFSTSE